MPGSIVELHFADCHSFDLSQHSQGLRRLEVRGNWSVTVMLHDRKQKRIHMQLSTSILLEGCVLHKGYSISFNLFVVRF